MPEQIEDKCPMCEEYLHSTPCKCGCMTLKQDHYCDDICDIEIKKFLVELKKMG